MFMKNLLFAGPVSLSPHYMAQVQDVYDAFDDMHTTMLRLVPDGRHRSIAITNLETASMYAVKGICAQAQAETDLLNEVFVAKIERYTNDKVDQHRDIHSIIRDYDAETEASKRLRREKIKPPSFGLRKTNDEDVVR